MIRAMRCSVVTAYVTMMVAMTLIGYGPMPTWAQGQSQPPSFVDERRLPDFGGVLSKEQQSGEQLSAETEARRKAAEEEAARQKFEEQERARQAAEAQRKVAEEEAARQKSEEQERTRQAAEAQRKAAEEEAARQKSEEQERARQAAEAQRKAAEEEAARQKSEEQERARQAAEAQRKAAEEEAARQKSEEQERARQAAEAQRKAAEEEAARQKSEEQERARQAAEAQRKAAEEEAARQKSEEQERARQAAEVQRKAAEEQRARQQGNTRRRTAADEIAQRMSSGGACKDLKVATQPQPAGRLEIKLQSTCLVGRPVTFIYAGYQFQRTMGENGELTFLLDMFEGAAPLALKLEDGATINIDTSGVNFAQVSKVAVLWSAPINLDLHAFEYLAPRNGPGHVWSKSPASVESALSAAREGSRGRGFLSTEDAGTGTGPHVEVYTFLHNKNQHNGAITLMIDYETRGDVPNGDYCGKGKFAVIEALVVRLRPGGKVEKENVRLGSAPCGQKLPESKRFNSDTLSDLLARG